MRQRQRQTNKEQSIGFTAKMHGAEKKNANKNENWWGCELTKDEQGRDEHSKHSWS